ncbi:MAG: FliH/SctL family protein [Phycisphaerae bacterium]
MGTVIKADGAGKIKKRLETLALKDHMAEAQRVVRRARSQAVQILADARQEIERRRTEAQRTGYQDGFAEGRAAGESIGREEAFAAAKAEFNDEQQPLLSALGEMVAAFDSAKEDLLDRARHDMLVLAVAIAERITKRTAAVDREAAVANSKEAMGLIAAGTDIVIRINPADRDRMSTYAAELGQSLARREHVTVVEDEVVGPGGCVVETAQTRIDATIEGQFREAAELVLGDVSALDGGSGGETNT